MVGGGDSAKGPPAAVRFNTAAALERFGTATALQSYGMAARRRIGRGAQRGRVVCRALARRALRELAEACPRLLLRQKVPQWPGWGDGYGDHWRKLGEHVAVDGGGGRHVGLGGKRGWPLTAPAVTRLIRPAAAVRQCGGDVCLGMRRTAVDENVVAAAGQARSSGCVQANAAEEKTQCHAEACGSAPAARGDDVAIHSGRF